MDCLPKPFRVLTAILVGLLSLAIPASSIANPIETILAPGNVERVAILPDGSSGFTTTTSGEAPRNVLRFNPTTGTQTASIALRSGWDYATSLDPSPDGANVYVGVYEYGDARHGWLARVQAATGAIDSWLSLGDSYAESWPGDVAVDSAGSFAYVLQVHEASNGQRPLIRTLEKINLTTFSVVSSFSLPTDYWGNTTTFDLSSDGTFAYIPDPDQDRILKLNTSSGVYSSMAAGDNPITVDVSPNGRHAVSRTDAGFDFFDLESANLTEQVTLPQLNSGQPAQVVYDPSGRFIFASGSALGREVAKIDVAAAQVVARIPAGIDQGVFGLAIDPVGDYLFAARGSNAYGIAKVDLYPPPIAGLSTLDREPELGTPVTFDASSTVANWGEPKTFTWDLDGNGSYETDSGSTASVSKAFDSLGLKTVGVKVTADTGVDTATTSVTVVPDNIVAQVSGPDTPVATEESISFDAGSSRADSGAISKYEWDLDGDGTFDPGEVTASTSFNERGTKTIAVRVTSRGGEVATAETTVDVRPAPPAGEIGVSINGGDIATNDPKVQLRLVWPRLVSNALVSNDGGFVPSETIPVSREIPWTLRSSGPERQPRIVYVRFRGWEDSPLTFTDDIILDERPPEVIEASGLAGPSTATRSIRRKARTVKVGGKDDNSGLASVIVSKKPRGKAIVTKRLARPGTRGKRNQKTTVNVPAKVKRAYVRVTDVAGNSSRPKRVK